MRKRGPTRPQLHPAWQSTLATPTADPVPKPWWSHWGASPTDSSLLRMSPTKPSLPEEPEFHSYATRNISGTREIPGPSDPILWPLSLGLHSQLGGGPRALGAMTFVLLSSSTPAGQTPTSSLDPDRIYFSICPTDGPSKSFEIMASVSLGQLRVGDTEDKAEKAAISQKARTQEQRSGGACGLLPSIAPECWGSGSSVLVGGGAALFRLWKGPNFLWMDKRSTKLQAH